MNLVEIAPQVSLVILVVSMILTSTRLFRGPSLADRIVAFDQMALIAIGIVAVRVFISRHVSLLDSGIAVGLVGFMGTVGLSRYLERSKKDPGETEP